MTNTHYIWHMISWDRRGIEVGWLTTLVAMPLLHVFCTQRCTLLYHVVSMCELRHPRHPQQPSSWWQLPRNMLLTTQLSSAPHSIAVQSFDHSFDRAWNYAANASAFIMVHPIFLDREKLSLVLSVDRYCTDLYRSWLASAEDGQNGAACVVRFLQEMAPRGCGCVASASAVHMYNHAVHMYMLCTCYVHVMYIFAHSFVFEHVWAF